MSRAALFLAAAALYFAPAAGAKDPTECEVCRTVVEAVRASLAGEKDLVKIEGKIEKYCAKPANEKESKLCYYIDPIKRELSTPLKNGVPSDVICQRLKKKSAEICALRYAAKPAGEEITAASDFSKLRVSQLKAYLAEKNVDCASCFEKADFEQAVKRHLGVKDL